jgi:hypothetical protein
MMLSRFDHPIRLQSPLAGSRLQSEIVSILSFCESAANQQRDFSLRLQLR